jgi:hypothetical protein
MAKKIQDGERAAGNSDFQAFVFEGKASESVTCNALEWIYSYGGGSVIGPDKKVSINKPNAIKALDTARSWIGTISPVGVTSYSEEEARSIWQAGNAAFMRNWPYAFALGADPKSAVSGKFNVTVLPKGGENGKNAACLGSWQLMISAYSKVPDVAADLVRYLSSAEVQKKGAIHFSVLPTGQPCIAIRMCWQKTLFLRSWWMYSTTPWPGLLLLRAPTTINCPRHFSRTSMRCSLAANQPSKRCRRWKRSQTELRGKTPSRGDPEAFAGGVLHEKQFAARNYQRGSRKLRPSDPLALWRRYSA